MASEAFAPFAATSHRCLIRLPLNDHDAATVSSIVLDTTCIRLECQSGDTSKPSPLKGRFAFCRYSSTLNALVGRRSGISRAHR